MSNRKKEVKTEYMNIIADGLNARLKELNLTIYSLIKHNVNYNFTTAYRIFRGEGSYNINTLCEFLDELGLTIKIVKKDENKD